MLALLFCKDPVIGEALSCLIRSIAAVTVLNAGPMLELVEGQLTGSRAEMLIFTEEFEAAEYADRIRSIRDTHSTRLVLITGSRSETIDPELFHDVIYRSDGSVQFALAFRAAVSKAGGNKRASTRTADLGEHPSDPGSPRLTVREVQVAKLLVEGLSNQEIADSLGVSLPTAKLYVGRLLKVFGAKNRVHLSNRLRVIHSISSQG